MLNSISIAIADDEALFRKGMKLILNSFENLEVNLEAENGRDLIQKLDLADQHPDILLLDLKMPEKWCRSRKNTSRKISCYKNYRFVHSFQPCFYCQYD